MEIDAVYGDRGKKGKHANGKKGKDRGKGKHKGKHESSPKFEGCCGHYGKWGTSRKTVDTRTLLPKWMRRNLSNSTQQCEQQHDPSHTTSSWFVFTWNCAVHDGIDLHADGGSRAVWLAL